MDAAYSLTKNLVNVKYENIPHEVAEHTKKQILDIPVCQWEQHHWPSHCGPATCGSILTTLIGQAGIVSFFRVGMARCCSIACFI